MVSIKKQLEIVEKLMQQAQEDLKNDPPGILVVGKKEEWTKWYVKQKNQPRRYLSKSEKMIADKLLRMGVRYRYEFPTRLKGYGIVHSDFTLLDLRERIEVKMEHFGRMDDPDEILLKRRRSCSKVSDHGRAVDIPLSAVLCYNMFRTMSAELEAYRLKSRQRNLKHTVRNYVGASGAVPKKGESF